jgi:hypothetical protein
MEKPLSEWLISRVVELSYTAWDMRPFARDLGDDGPPFRWDEERRSLLRAELDAAYFHLYGVERDDIDYILNTFPIVQRKDEARFGEYRTKRLILDIYDAMSTSVGTGAPYQTVLDPPAGYGPRHPARLVVQDWPAPSSTRRPRRPPAPPGRPRWTSRPSPGSGLTTAVRSPKGSPTTTTGAAAWPTTRARLARRFRDHEDMILRFATDLTVAFTNNQAERDARPVKVQQRTSGGCWRTLDGLADFAVVHSYHSTATKWGVDKLDVLRELFTTGPWLPPALARLNSYGWGAERYGDIVAAHEYGATRTRPASRWRAGHVESGWMPAGRDGDARSHRADLPGLFIRRP